MSAEIEAAMARQLARLAHAHRGLYGTDDPAELPPMALKQVEQVRLKWGDPVEAPRLIVMDRLSRPAV